VVAFDQHYHPAAVSQALGPRSGLERLIDGLWLVWITTLPLGHVTGLHNTLAIVTIALTLVATRGRGLLDTPGLGWLVALLAFASLSLAWSPHPDVSGGKLRSDLLLPILGYFAAFQWSRRGGSPAMFRGFALGLALLILFSLIDLVPAGMSASWPWLDAPDASGHRMPHWYPGVGDASGDVVLVLGPLLVWRYLAGHWRDATSSLLALGAVLVVLVSKNRDAVLLLPLGVGLFALLWADRSARRGPDWSAKRRWPLWTAVVLVVVIAGLLVIELVSQRRLADARIMVPFGHATGVLLALDPRPQMWAEYLHLGLAHTWFGVGYGRTVPAVVYDVAHDPVMQASHANGLEHAHNFFLNIWLQLGLVGLALVVVVLAVLVWQAVTRRSRNQLAALCSAGVLTLIATTLLRNSLDDFLVYSMASAFWIGVGLLLGLGDTPIEALGKAPANSLAQPSA
jgi:O-antigen ligase